MNLLIILMFYLCSAFGHVKIQPRIFGGEDAAEGQFPHQVSVRFDGKLGCGGSIVGPNTVLTTGLCIIQYTNNTKLINVVAGSHKLNGGTTYNVTKIYAHPKFNLNISLHYDLAIVKVTPPFTYSDSIKLIKLARKSVSDNQNVVATGFGITHTRGDPSEILQFIKVKTLNLEICRREMPGEMSDFLLGDSSICTVPIRRGGTCFTDYGGALINEGVEQVGVISFSDCPSFIFPDVYTNVVSHKEWIEEQITL